MKERLGATIEGGIGSSGEYKLKQFVGILSMLPNRNGDDSFELPVLSDINHRTRMEPSEVLEIVKSL